ncbi:cytochrome P450 [Nocardia paucivorans]|uniref:cytochrome P450 n=1 Tax=Nocardia paucivorans TaxID=114259 RepID=UPI000592B24E|nr:cytochrome P450 [Nocardia paucivorans]
MSTAQPDGLDSTPHTAHRAPWDAVGPRIPLYEPEFAADPHKVYQMMRERYRSLVPVDLAPGVPATLVIEHRTAVAILNDHEHFPADPRTWQEGIPADCPVLPIMEWRPIAARSTGIDQQRYREANVAGLAEVDMHALRASVERIAVPLVNSFCETGTADLIAQYAFPLAFESCNVLLGCPPEIGQRVAAGMAAMFEGIDADEGNRMIGAALAELVAAKRDNPGDDVTSLLLRHPAELDEFEMIHQVTSHYGAGIELQQNLIANALLLILSDSRFGGSVLGGSLSTRDALDEVLFDNPPMANFLITYPRQPILIEDVWLPAHQPVVIGIAACNHDPAIRADDHKGNRSHLSWGLGQRNCPAQNLAYIIAQEAIDQLLDALPEMQLDFPDGIPTWRPGPFHRSLTALPVTFTPAPPLNVM